MLTSYHMYRYVPLRPLFSQVTQSFRANGGMQQWVRIFADADVVEVEHHVGKSHPGQC